jgi:hypothetical protein
MATHPSTRRHRTRKSAPRRLAAAFAEHWLLAFAAHVTATIVVVVTARALGTPGCG